MGMYPNAHLGFGINIGNLAELDPEKNPWMEQFDDENGFYDVDGFFDEDDPIEAFMYCNYEDSYWVLAIRGTVHESGDWDCSKIDLVPPSEETIQFAKEYCETLGIPWGEPGWQLAAFYG